MAQDLRLVLRITGDANGLKTEVIGSQKAVEDLGRTGRGAGAQINAGTQEASNGLREMAGTAVRGVAAFAGFSTAVAILRSVAVAGDEMNAALARVAIASGGAASAIDVYSDLYRLAQQTGIATNEAAGAFQRFAIAAREAGASRSQILSIVQLMQQAGALAGASTQEAASATLQLGQALASGRLQGDELRSILEAMPNLAEALARELGVGIGQLRKMGEEGKLTSDVVIPALVRSAQRMNEEFQKLPPSLSRSMSVLRETTTRFLADLDRAASLSQRIAAALGSQGVAGVIETARRQLGLGTAAETAEVEVSRARSDLIAARRAQEAADRAAADAAGTGNNLFAREAAIAAAATAQAERALREREERLATLRGQANDREQSEDRTNAERGAESRRQEADARLEELRDSLARERVIRREAREAEERIAAGVSTGAISEGDAAGLRNQVQRRMREDLARLNARPAAASRETGGFFNRLADDADKLKDRLRTPFETATQELNRYRLMLAGGLIDQNQFNRAVEDLNQNAREPFDRLMASLDPATAALQQYAQQSQVIADAMARGVISEEEYADAVRRSSEALAQRLQQAQAEADGTAEAQRRLQDGARSLGFTFASSFEDAILEGKKLGDVLKSLERDIARIVLRKTVTEPLGGAIASALGGAVVVVRAAAAAAG